MISKLFFFYGARFGFVRRAQCVNIETSRVCVENVVSLWIENKWCIRIVYDVYLNAASVAFM